MRLVRNVISSFHQTITTKKLLLIEWKVKLTYQTEKTERAVAEMMLLGLKPLTKQDENHHV